CVLWRKAQGVLSAASTMEKDLESLLVGVWIQGDRAKLQERVHALERELGLVLDGQRLAEEAFRRERERLTDNLVRQEEEALANIRTLAERAGGEEKLRRICQGRVREMETQASLCEERARLAEVKFQRAEEALRREVESSRCAPPHPAVPERRAEGLSTRTMTLPEGGARRTTGGETQEGEGGEDQGGGVKDHHHYRRRRRNCLHGDGGDR
ncbi:unnamed protein product, partial [Discosporangium mesarthrocarpum]